MIRKLAIVGAIVTAAVALMAGPAFAHVEIEREGDVSDDGVVAATLTVPNEEADAGTVTVVLVFPASPKLTDAQPEAVNGWTATVEKSASGDVERVTWTGGPLTGEDEVALPLSIGDVPADVDSIDFTAIQSYDNGTDVSWSDPTPEGGEEPEHPAPVLTVRGEAAGHDDEGETDDHAAGEDSHDDGLSTGAIVAIVVGIVLVLAIIGFFVSRSRRDKGSTTA